MAARKPNQGVRPGDEVVVEQGPRQRQRAVRVLALGTRRGPAAEARSLYEETVRPPAPDRRTQWLPLLFDDISEPGSNVAD